MKKKRYYEGILYVVNKRLNIRTSIITDVSFKSKRQIANKLRGIKAIEERSFIFNGDRFYFRIKKRRMKEDSK